MRIALASLLAAAALAARSAVPTVNYSDMWYLPAESGWGVSFQQHSGSNQVFAVWFTYDPRRAAPGAPQGVSSPLWIVMSGGTWTTPTSITGPVYVLNGKPYDQAGSDRALTQVGSFTFNFTTSSSGTFTYDIAPPAGLSSGDPAFGLPRMSATKEITRQAY